jgi:hypothetical protein
MTRPLAPRSSPLRRHVFRYFTLRLYQTATPHCAPSHSNHTAGQLQRVRSAPG